jgi:hypothetical protein
MDVLLIDAERRQGVALASEILRVGGDAGVTDELDSDCSVLEYHHRALLRAGLTAFSRLRKCTIPSNQDADAMVPR